MHEMYMRLALQEAQQALEEEEVPVGAVIVHADRVIARAHNQREQLRDPTAHAEMIAITQAAESLGSWRLEDCTLYATLEPCPMCAGAIVHARLRRVIFGCPDPKMGGAGGLFNILQNPALNHRCDLTSGVKLDECRGNLREFFLGKRGGGGKDEL